VNTTGYYNTAIGDKPVGVAKKAWSYIKRILLRREALQVLFQQHQGCLGS